ncbi:MAG: division plane positioning ATPase MipZ [Pseudomonadota bacterium]
MHTICLLSLKGGAGKSTVVQSLAVSAVQHGQKTLVVELDPQGTLKNWSNRREAIEPRVIQTLPQSLEDVLEEARQDDVNWVFLDTPGHNASTAAAAAEHADIILVPCKIQSVKDFDSVLASLSEAKRVQKPAYVLMTQVPPNARKFARDRQVEIQQHYDVAVLSKYLSRRVDFEYCDAKGLSASELRPDGEAAKEINRLYTLIQSIFIMLKPRADQVPVAAIEQTSVEHSTGIAKPTSMAIPHSVTIPEQAPGLVEVIEEEAEAIVASTPAPLTLVDSADNREMLSSDREDPDDPMDIPSFVKSYNRLRAEK